MLKKLLIRYGGPELVGRLRRMSIHRPEVIVSLTPGDVAPPCDIPLLKQTRWRFVRQWILENYVTNPTVSGPQMFLNVGCGDGTLRHQFFGHESDEKPLTPQAFFGHFRYYTTELFPIELNSVKLRGGHLYADHVNAQDVDTGFLRDYPEGFHTGHFQGDISTEDFLETRSDYLGKFDLIYSADVLEHVGNPFTAVKNMVKLLKPGGKIITIVPFAYGYHPDPVDYYRFTHAGVQKMFEIGTTRVVKEVFSAYDLTERRRNRIGPLVPVDQFGGWREAWFVLTIHQID